MDEQIRPVAIVTGAGSGIGRAIALALGRSGFGLVLVGRRPEPLAETDEELPEGVESISVPLDVSDPASGEAMVAAAVAKFGRVDVLVNNAGYAPMAAIDETEAGAIQRAYMTNAVGPACAIAAAWRAFRTQREEGVAWRLGPCIVNISTMGTADPFAGFFAYASSKIPVNLMAKICATEGKPLDIRAFAIAPGAVETRMLRSLFTTDVVPRERCLTPQRVAEEVLACVLGERAPRNGETIMMPGP
ncbi:MAG TPA: SDR family oxidoreductase [Phycisphaerales bacterium]|nr:SDR family oxidoreductase [Phycisphaerales bacterium]